MEDDRNMSLPSMDSLLGLGIGLDVPSEALLGYESQPLPDDVLAGMPSLDWPELQHEQVAAAANRAMEMPLQEHALYGPSGMVQMRTPSMQQLEAEQEEQMRFHHQQQYMYGLPQPLPGSLAGSSPQYVSSGGAHQPADLAGFQQPQYGGQPGFFQGSAASAQRPSQALQGLPQQLPGTGVSSGIPGIGYSGAQGPFEGSAARGPPLGHHFSHSGDPLSSGSSGGIDAGRSGSWGNTPSQPSGSTTPPLAAPAGEGLASSAPRRDEEGGTPAALHVEQDKKLKIKEKNRRAQQRFRERQRQKLSESQERAQALRASITQLQIEHELLVSRNTMLEKFKSVRQGEEQMAAGQGRHQLEGPPGAPHAAEEPQASSSSSSQQQQQQPMTMDIQSGSMPKVPGAALVLTVKDDQHVTLTTEQIKRMRWTDHAKIWKEYVNRLAELLVEAHADPETEAGRRAAVLVREAVTLAATISIHNPRGYRTWHCNRMETGSEEGDLPDRDFWYNIMKCLKMPVEQRNGMRQLRRLYLGRLGDVMRKRDALAKQLQPHTDTFDGGRATVAEYLKVVDITEQLQANLAEEHKLLQMYMINISFRIGRPLQAASVIVQAYPWAPDMLAIINCLAEEEGDPSASQLLSMGYEAAVGLQGRIAAADDGR